MTTTWTDIAKATGTTYTDVPKPLPTSSVATNIYSGGQPIGLLLSLTSSSIIGQIIVVTSKWSNVAKNSTPWTDVPKPT